MGTRRIELIVDDGDFDAIQGEIAKFQAQHHCAYGETVLPEGESNLAGAIIAESIRSLDEYRRVWEMQNPRK